MFDIKELDTYICYFTNCIEDPKKLINTINEFNENKNSITRYLSKWSDWTASNSPKDIYGQNMFSSFSHLEDTNIDETSKYIISTIKNAFQSCAEKYKDFYNFEYPVNLDSEFGIKKYYVGQGLGSHADQYDGNMRLRYSMVLYLNDDYEGGELYFENHNIMVKPEAGSLAIFPSSEPFLHASKDLISGAKIMCPAFWMNEDYL